MIYRNFNMIPKDNIDTSELVNIIPFKDGNDWYLELIYEYENHKGKHTVIFPKAALPFSQKGFPTIRCNISDDDIYQLHAYTDKFTFYPHSDLLERPYIVVIVQCLYTNLVVLLQPNEELKTLVTVLILSPSLLLEK